MHDVFISYAQKDQEIAYEICNKLEKNKINCWIAPRDVNKAINFQDSLSQAIKECQAFLLIHSKNWNSSSFTKKEAEFAINAGKLLLPVKIDDAPLHSEISFIASMDYDPVSVVNEVRKNIINKNVSGNFEEKLLKTANDKSDLRFNIHEEPLVFISHRSKDKSKDKFIAHAVLGELEDNGIKCWIAPRDILPGEDWDDAIVDAIINKCLIMIVIFSGHVNDSDIVKKEVYLAASEGLHLITFRIEDALPQKGLKLHLDKKHWFDAITEPLDAHLQRLVIAVQTLIEMKNG